MNFFQIFFKLVPFIFSLMRMAEVVVTVPGAGAEKKALVKGGLTAMYDEAKAVSTGGQKETLELADPLVDSVIDKGIDLAASMMFKK